MNIIEKLESLGKNSIQLEECFSEGRWDLGASRFGGNPDVPPDFVWPTYEGEDHKNVVKERPLSFLAQFACAGSGSVRQGTPSARSRPAFLLLMKVILSPGAMTPRTRAALASIGLRILSVLSTADFPADMEDAFSLPMGIEMESTFSYPSLGRTSAKCSRMKIVTLSMQPGKNWSAKTRRSIPGCWVGPI